MIDSELESRVRRYWGEVWSAGHVAYLDEFYAPRFRENDEDLTPAQFGQHVLGWREKFPDFAVTVDRLWGWPGGIATRVTYAGTHLGDFSVLAATGRTVRSGGLDVFEFDGECVVQHWHETDHYDLFAQLGARVTAVRAASGRPHPASSRDTP